jgi:hypothetical protein
MPNKHWITLKFLVFLCQILLLHYQKTWCQPNLPAAHPSVQQKPQGTVPLPSFNTAMGSPHPQHQRLPNSIGLLRFQHSPLPYSSNRACWFHQMSALPSQFGVSPYDKTYLQYCGSTTTVCSSVGEWSLLSPRWRITITGNGSFTDYAPGLSIKTNNYILPYSLQVLTRNTTFFFFLVLNPIFICKL